jgi:aflatoxin B1 aldehyde reductase
MASTKLNIVFGAMTIGREGMYPSFHSPSISSANPAPLGTLGARVHTIEGATSLFTTFQKHNHNEIDTARVYGDGSTEEIQGAIPWQEMGIVTATKLYPSAGIPLFQGSQYNHTPADVRRGLMDSLKALKCEKIDMFYLHGPDRKHPFEDTLREVNALYKEGYFNRFGISNYQSWEVAQICEICIRNNWISPSVYQGIYHGLQRSIEAELFPCLRRYGISLYAFQPLAGGFLTGRYTRDQTAFEKGSRFDPSIAQGSLHRGRYWNEAYFDALEMIQKACEKHGLTVAEVAMRWLEHHSLMSREKGDSIIVGASSVNHLEENLVDLEKGPLPDDVVEVMEKAWAVTKGSAPKYWH